MANRVRRRFAALPPFIVVPVAFNLWVLRSERLAVHNLNDTSVHMAMVRWATARLRDGHMPFDGWFPRVSAGLGQFHHYQSLPHVIAGAVGVTFGPDATVRWILYLGLALWPVAVYAAARLFELDRGVAVAAAVISPLLVSTPSYGYEHASYTWQGLGVWSQLWGMWLLPIAAALSWRAVRSGRGYAPAAITLGLTFACHFLTGYLAMLSLGVWVVITPSQFVTRLRRAVVVGASSLVIIAWVVVPLLRDAPYAAQTVFNRDTYWNDSFGARKILGWLVSGELFDSGRWPIVSVLAAVGALVCIAGRRDERCRALLGLSAVSLVLFFGRATFGSWTRLLPGGGDLIMHRFIMGVHLGGLLLAATGATWLGRKAWRYGRDAGIAVMRPGAWSPAVALAVVLVVALAPAWRQIARYDQRDDRYIPEQHSVDETDGADFARLARRASSERSGLTYAGMTNNWARTEHRIGSLPLYVDLLNDDVDAIGFTLRTVSLLSDVEAYFDETNPAAYALFNVRHVVLPVNRPAPPNAELVDRAGRFRLYRVPTSGYVAVVDSVAPPIVTNRRGMNRAPGEFLRGLTDRDLRRLPTVAFGGRKAAAASLPVGAEPEGAPGSVTAQSATPDHGVFRASVTAERNAVVVLKQTFTPRWSVRVDGRRVTPQMLAPGFVGVPVTRGTHEVTFEYRSFQYYWLLFALCGACVAALVAVDRRAIRPAWLS